MTSKFFSFELVGMLTVNKIKSNNAKWQNVNI